MIKYYADVFSVSEYDVGCTDIMTASINTGDAHPFAERLRTHARAYRDDVDVEVDKFLKAGIIEEAASPWNSNLVLIRKKEMGKLRITVDLRRLNELSYKDKHPLPRISECLDSLSQKVWFGSLDISQSYYQVALAVGSRDCTAFSTRRGQFGFTQIPQGHCNSPAVFSRLMQLVLRGLNYLASLISR